MQNPIEKRDYRGKRAALYLRVSTEDQKKNYSFRFQERDCRALIEELGMILNDEKHIVKDAYTGMDWRERPELTHILEMAKRQEFDILVMWKLDRFARKGIHQSIIREELKYHGVSILTLDPDEHADDESPLGEVIRSIYGFVAETERNNILQRSIEGKRSRAMEGRLLGNAYPLYGYKWLSDKPKERDTYVINPEEAEVVRNVYKWYLEGMTLRGIAMRLNEIGVKTRKAKMLAEGKKVGKRCGDNPIWQASTVLSMLTHPFYIGNASMFRRKRLEKAPGRKYYPVEFRQENECIQMPEGVVPQIIDEKTFESVQTRLTINKRNSPRNNPDPQAALLRAGLAKCGYCGGNVTIKRGRGQRKGPNGEIKDRIDYRCSRGGSGLGRCRDFFERAYAVDEAAWSNALEIINNPSLVDEKINALRSKDPTQEHRTRYTAKIAEIEQKQKRLRDKLEDEDLDPETYQDFKQRLKRYAEEKSGYEEELSNKQLIHKKWSALNDKLNDLHQFCAEMRERMSDPEYIPPYKKKREACELFGIYAIIWGAGHTPRFEIKCSPPDIMSLLS